MRAEYFEGVISLKSFAAAHPEYRVLCADPLVLEPEAGTFVVLFKFGSVVFWGAREELVRAILAEIAAAGTVGRLLDEIRDDLVVLVEQEEDRVEFKHVWLRRLTLEHLKLLSMALAQSVALESFELQVTQAVSNTEPLVREMRSDGRVRMAERDILRTIGLALHVRSAVLANLTLFDNPPETWISEALSRLDTLLYDHFDLEERLSAVNQKVAYLSDVNELLMGILQHRKSNRLEWIVIVLIAVEIVFFAWMELK